MTVYEPYYMHYYNFCNIYTYFVGVSIGKEALKKEVSGVCQEWIKLINNHEKSLHEWIDSMEQQELDKHKSINDKLNGELKLVQETKTKCRGLMSFASVDDIFKTSASNEDNDDSKDNIVSLVDKCVSQLDKSLVVPDDNIFTKMKFNQFNADSTQV